MRIIGILLGIVVVAAGLIGLRLTYLHRFELYPALKALCCDFVAHGSVRFLVVGCSMLVVFGFAGAIYFAFGYEKKN